MTLTRPFNLQKWVDDHRDLLVPPVNNKQVFKESTFIVIVVGGPNERTDFHVNSTDELFYQLEGKMLLRIIDQGQFKDIPIHAGEIFMLPRGVPHSPQRFENSIGLVVEKTRTLGDEDKLKWYCKKCCHLLYQESFFLENIETQFAAIFDRYYSSQYKKCSQCGTLTDKIW